jgi:hypothetical protein
MTIPGSKGELWRDVFSQLGLSRRGLLVALFSSSRPAGRSTCGNGRLTTAGWKVAPARLPQPGQWAGDRGLSCQLASGHPECGHRCRDRWRLRAAHRAADPRRTPAVVGEEPHWDGPAAGMGIRARGQAAAGSGMRWSHRTRPAAMSDAGAYPDRVQVDRVAVVVDPQVDVVVGQLGKPRGRAARRLLRLV